MQRKKSYVVVWWDAFGNPHQINNMQKQEADTLASTMLPEQEAIVFLVYEFV
jgi:hypothetical protein